MTEYTEEEQKQHRTELVSALRSGKYAQTQNCLRDGTGYCCLGVACDISKMGEWVLATSKVLFFYQLKSGECVTSSLPDPVKDYFGFHSTEGDFGNDYAGRSLASLNDSGASFEKIADIIESEPDGLCI